MKDWFRIYDAMVEEDNDPMKLGRVRIRVLGVHSEKKNQDDYEGIPTDDLPWAHLSLPIVGAGPTGIGSIKPPTKGTWVNVLPKDSNLQRWLVIGAISGFPQEEAKPNLGFNDPSGKYPIYDRIEEQDTNRLARNENIDKTIIETKIRELVKGVRVAGLIMTGPSISAMDTPTDTKTTYDEPQEPYSTEYPHNRVFESDPLEWRSGHIFEIDDTPGAERIHIWHKAGTSKSIHWEGQQVEKIVGDNYIVNLQSDFNFINYDRITTIKGDDRVLVRSSKQEEVYGYKRSYVKGNDIEYVSGDLSLWVGADLVDDPEMPTIKVDSKKRDGSKPEIPEKNLPTINKIGGNFNMKIENCKHFLVKGNEFKTVEGTFWIEVTGTRDYDRNKVGSPGDYGIEPHGEYIVKGHKMSRVKGGKLYRDYGCISTASTCPYTLAKHTFGSRTVKVSE